MSCAASGDSCSLRPSRRARCSRHMTRRARRRCPASTPSTTPGRPTGPWRFSTEPSRARAGAGPRTAPAHTWRRRATRSKDHWPPIPDHWAAYGMSETVEFPERGRPPLTEDEADYARRQAELFGIQARWLSQWHGPWGRLVRGSYEARGGWYGVVGEALTGWWLTSREEPRMADLREPIAERARCIAGTGGGRAVRRGGCGRCCPAGAGGGRVVRRRRDPHGRPATCAGRPLANHPDRRGGRGRQLVRARRQRAVGLVVGPCARAGAQPGPGGVRGSPRGAVAADRCRRGRRRRA